MAPITESARSGRYYGKIAECEQNLQYVRLYKLFLLLIFSDINKPPTANAGPDVVVYLPNRAAELVGSSSYDDHGIVEYEWTRDPKSPAAGVS